MSAVSRAIANVMRAICAMAAVALITAAAEIALPSSMRQTVFIVALSLLAGLFIYAMGFALRSWYLSSKLRSSNAWRTSHQDIDAHARTAYWRRQMTLRLIGVIGLVAVVVWKIRDFYLRP